MGINNFMRYYELFEASRPRRVSSRHRVFFRGTVPGRTERIRTGDEDWDRRLFVSSVRSSALMYGPNITTFTAKPEAKILYEGTKDFRSVAKGLFKRGARLLPIWSEIVRRAEAAGYDAVWFKRQGDVGTVVINPEAFVADTSQD